MQNREDYKKQYLSDVSIISDFKYYTWCGGETSQVIYDSFLDIPIGFINGKLNHISRGTFQDYYDEVVDPKKIELLFNNEMKQEVIKYLKQIRESLFYVRFGKYPTD